MFFEYYLSNSFCYDALIFFLFFSETPNATDDSRIWSQEKRSQKWLIRCRYGQVSDNVPYLCDEGVLDRRSSALTPYVLLTIPHQFNLRTHFSKLYVLCLVNRDWYEFEACFHSLISFYFCWQIEIVCWMSVRWVGIVIILTFLFNRTLKRTFVVYTLSSKRIFIGIK